jgi:hypothetical protein
VPIWEKIANFTKQASLNIGDAAHGLGQLLTGGQPRSEVQQRQQFLGAWTAQMMFGIPTGAWDMLKAQPAGAPGTPQDSGKHIANPIVEKLDQLMNMLRGHA